MQRLYTLAKKVDVEIDHISLQVLISMDYSVDEIIMTLIEIINTKRKCLFVHYLTTNTEIPSEVDIREYVNELNISQTAKTFSAEDRRIAKIFGKPDPDYIPNPSNRSLPTYSKYLAENLKLPLRIRFEGQNAKLIEIVDIDATEDVDFYGLLVIVVVGKKVATVPLVEIDLIGSSESEKLIDDYQYWFENFR